MDGFVKLVKFGIYAGALYCAYSVGFGNGYSNARDELERQVVPLIQQVRQDSLSRLERRARTYYEGVRSDVDRELSAPVEFTPAPRPPSNEEKLIEVVRTYLDK